MRASFSVWVFVTAFTLPAFTQYAFAARSPQVHECTNEMEFTGTARLRTNSRISEEKAGRKACFNARLEVAKMLTEDTFCGVGLSRFGGPTLEEAIEFVFNQRVSTNLQRVKHNGTIYQSCSITLSIEEVREFRSMFLID